MEHVAPMMKLLLTNDDGIDAAGLAALETAIRGEVYVAAPHRQRSECGHQVTTRDRIVVTRRSETRVAVHGTPVDCVRLALRGGLFGSVSFDWVLSGINEGGNLGVDVYISGTVAAAREAAILGRPAIAFSHYRRAGVDIDWALAAALVGGTFEDIQNRKMAREGHWNVNLPHRREPGDQVASVDCQPCRNPLPIRYQSDGRSEYQYSGIYAERVGEPGSDVEHCFAGSIAVSYIPL